MIHFTGRRKRGEANKKRWAVETSRDVQKNLTAFFKKGTSPPKRRFNTRERKEG